MCPQSVARYCKQTLCITSVYQATLCLLGRLCTKVDANKDLHNSPANFLWTLKFPITFLLVGNKNVKLHREAARPESCIKMVSF